MVVYGPRIPAVTARISEYPVGWSTVAADTSRRPRSRLDAAFHDADQLAPDTRCHAMPADQPRTIMTSPASTLFRGSRAWSRASHGRLRTLAAGIRYDLRSSRSTQSPLSSSATAGVWSSTTLSASIVARSMRDKCRTDGSLPQAKMSSIMLASPEHPAARAPPAPSK